jgi:hypothetical protein
MEERDHGKERERMDTQGACRLRHAAGALVIAAALLVSVSRPAAASHVELCYFGLQCVRKTHDGPIWALSRDEPYVVNYIAALNGRNYVGWQRVLGPYTGVDSGESVFGEWCFTGRYDDPQHVIWLVAVMERDRSNFDSLLRRVSERLFVVALDLRAASANRATWVARLIDEMDRALREEAVATAGGGDPDDLIARPQEVPLSSLDFAFAGGGASLVKRVQHVGSDGHYVTLHRLRPR